MSTKKQAKKKIKLDDTTKLEDNPKNKKKELDKKEVKKKSKVELLKEDLEKEKEKYIRLYAEFDNYKKRTSKEKIDMIMFANKETIKDLLPILDDIDIAKEKITNEEDKGVILIIEKLYRILNSKGLEVIKVKKGDKLDVDIHEAVTNITIEDDKLDGKIFDVISKGYKLNSKIIRHSKVVIGQKKK